MKFKFMGMTVTNDEIRAHFQETPCTVEFIKQTSLNLHPLQNALVNLCRVANDFCWSVTQRVIKYS
jgi:hypothetical protein